MMKKYSIESCKGPRLELVDEDLYVSSGMNTGLPAETELSACVLNKTSL